MNVKNVSQLSFEQLSEKEVDLIICSSGYEERSTYVASRLSLKDIRNRVVFLFKNEEQNITRLKNDIFFKENEFEMIKADGDSGDEIIDALKKIDFLNLKIGKIAVDYSTMTRVWYSAILKFFYSISNSSSVQLNFCYSFSHFVPSSREESYNVHIGPIRGFSNLTIPQKPTALIIGLGYERNRARGLSEYFDGETFVFYTDGTKEERYSKEVERNNRLLLSQLKKKNICRYPINDHNNLYTQLFNLCADLASSFRVIVAPCGPKPFTLISLIIALQQNSIDVWRISPGKHATVINKKPDGEITVFSISLDKSSSTK